MTVEHSRSRRKNRKLVAARERRMMPGGEPMQPQDVADEMNVFLWAEYQKDPKSPRPTTLDHRFVLAYEAGRHWWPSEHYRAAFRHVLGVASDAELGFTSKRRRRKAPARASEPEATASADPTAGAGVEGQVSDVALDAMKRRSLVSWAAIAAASGGISTGIGSPTSLLGSETARHALMLAATNNRPNASVDEWNEIVLDYGYDYLKESPLELLRRLNVDVIGLQLAMAHAGSDAERRELFRIGAMLAVFTAKTTSNAGRLHDALRWWRTARQVADESGDLTTILWIRGQEIIRALYDQRDMDAILTLIERTEDHASEAEAAMLPSFLSGKAQALAAAGRSADARATLQKLEQVYSVLPRQMTTVRHRESDLKWPLSKYLFTASYVHAHCGALPEAEEAQRQALEQYLPGHVRAPVQIKLHRALCMVAAGNVTEGLEYARKTMVRLPRSHYVRPIIDGAYTVLTAAPVEQRSHSAYTELANFLSARPAIEA